MPRRANTVREVSARRGAADDDGEPREHGNDATPRARLGSRSRIRAFVLLALTVAGVSLCLVLAVPFLPALTWALAMAIVFARPHGFIERRVKNRNLAAGLSVAAICLVIVVPMLLVGHRLVLEAIRGATAMKGKLESGEWQQKLANDGPLAVVAQWIEGANVAGVVGNLANWVAEWSGSFVRGWLVELITIVLAFYLAFYLLRDRKAILEWCEDISPLAPAETGRLFKRIGDTVHATLYGTVAVAVVQGALGALIFWLLGLPAPLLWGLVMGLLAIVPVLGAFIVWVPVALFLALDGSIGKALVLAAWGLVVIGGTDNVLHPVLVGDRLKLHTVPAFIAIVGGLLLFGPAGLLLGPIAMTVTVFALEFWRVRVRRREPDVGSRG